MADAAGGESGERVLRCQNCGRLTGTHFSALHDCASSVGSPHDFRELEVVPLSRAEAAEQQLREVKEALVVIERNAWAGKGPRQVARAALKRARTTTTEEVPHVRTAQG